jgi:hypothetical protein
MAASLRAANSGTFNRADMKAFGSHQPCTDAKGSSTKRRSRDNLTKPFELLPDLFMEQDLAADLTQDQNAALGDVRSAAQTESHKIVTQDWGIPPREVFDRFEAQRKAVRRQLGRL